VTCLAQDCYLGSEVPQLTDPSKKPPPQVVFSFLLERLRRDTHDLKKI